MRLNTTNLDKYDVKKNIQEQPLPKIDSSPSMRVSDSSSDN